MLVMLSPVPVVEDEGNVCTLPNGEQVKLRETFPSSGLYEVGSTVPVWTVGWYGEEGLVRLSEHGRYMVRINRFGGGGYGQGVRLRWGIRFYDGEMAIKGYDVGELVDYPSLMELETLDWHLLWFDPSAYHTEIEDRFYVLKTSTRERYRFDVTTGDIVEEHRFWRWVAGVGKAALAVLGALGAWLVYRRRKARRARAAGERLTGECCAEPIREEPIRKAKKLSYSLRSLMIVVTAAAIFCSIGRTAPHVAVLLVGIALAVLFTVVLMRTGHRIRGHSTTIFARPRRALLWLLTLGSWLLLYALSFAPVLGLVRYLGWPYDVWMVIAQVVYAPVYWLLVNTPIRDWHLLQLYFEAWEPW